VVEAMITGPTVEFGDKLSSWGQHDRIEPGRPIGNPSDESVFGGLGNVSDMDAAVIEVEVKCLWFAFAEAERRCRLSGVGEAVQLGQMQRAVGPFDVAEDTAGADRGELLIITNQPDTRTATYGELHGRLERKGVRHAGFIDDQQGRWADRGRPLRKVAVPQRPGELGQRVGADAGLLGENSGCGRGRGEAEHLAAVLGPGESEGAHGGGLSGACRGDRQLYTCPRGAHLADQEGLPIIECSPVRRHFE
jgi:hypothetical protein